MLDSLSHYEDTEIKFRPNAESRIISELTHEQIVNSYDNTIIATDKFLHALISRLRSRNAVMIYISDHGESLGEEGRYLHKTDAPEMRKSACVIWYSDKFAENYPEKVEALKNNKHLNLGSETMFHTALDAANLITPAKTDSLSLFKNK